MNREFLLVPSGADVDCPVLRISMMRSPLIPLIFRGYCLRALTLTAWITTKYYWENAIASSQEHLNGHENVGRPATHGGPRIETRGSHHIIAHPIPRQIGLSGSGVRVMTHVVKYSFLHFGTSLIVALRLGNCHFVQTHFGQTLFIQWPLRPITFSSKPHFVQSYFVKWPLQRISILANPTLSNDHFGQ